MRVIVTLVAVCAVLVGCAPAEDVTRDAAGPAPVSVPGGDPSSAEGSAPTESTSEWADEEGRSPDEALLELIAAIEADDWQTAYSLHAVPEVDFETAVREWSEADESYESFDIQETLVVDAQTAQVRVTYVAQTTPPGGERYTVVVDDPGEWWQLSNVDGLWKVNWMPRQ